MAYPQPHHTQIENVQRMIDFGYSLKNGLFGRVVERS